jgi:hypothetical protein
MPKIIIIVLVAFAVIGAGYGLSKVDWEAISEPTTSQVEDSTLSDIEKTSKIDNQKITAVNGNEITLENNSKFTVEKSDCQVGDVIQGYDDEKKSLICVGTVDNQPVTRYVYIPQDNSNLLTNLILADYFLGRGNLRNNGYAPTYVNNTTVYKGSNGAEITSNKNSKPTKTKAPTSSSNSSSDSKSSSDSGKSSSKSSNNGGKSSAPATGHGGGFGGGSSSTS